METYILAIDHGTTSTKAMLIGHDQKIHFITQAETPLFFPREGWVEQDPQLIWKTIRSLVSLLMAKAEILPEQILALGLSNQRESTLLWQKSTGKPIYPAIVWQSRQSESICKEWKEKGYESLIHEKTGLTIDPYFSASKLVWLFQHVPEARKLAEADDLLFGTMESWIAWNLSGGKAHISDITNASRTMLMNLKSGEWDRELLELFEIPENILPEIVDNSSLYFKTDPRSFNNLQIPVCSLIGDQQSALFGQLCLKKGMTKNTYGTGGFLLMNTGSEIIDSSMGLLSTVAWKFRQQVTYALEGSIFVSGSLLKWLRDELGVIEDIAQSEEMIEGLGDEQEVLIVPAFVGLGTPYWDEDVRASILNLSFSSTPAHLIKAALQAMAFQVKDVLDVMEKESGLSIDQLKVDGGASVNNYLLQYQADLLQKEVVRYEIKELTGLGAGFLAGLAAGFWNLDDLHIEAQRVFKPEKEPEIMKEEYALWQRGVEATRSL